MNRFLLKAAIETFESLEEKNREKVNAGDFEDEEDRASILGAAGAYNDAANYLRQEYYEDLESEGMTPLVVWPSGEPVYRSSVVDVSDFEKVRLLRTKSGVQLFVPRGDTDDG